MQLLTTITSIHVYVIEKRTSFQCFNDRMTGQQRNVAASIIKVPRLTYLEM